MHMHSRTYVYIQLIPVRRNRRALQGTPFVLRDRISVPDMDSGQKHHIVLYRSKDVISKYSFFIIPLIVKGFVSAISLAPPPLHPWRANRIWTRRRSAVWWRKSFLLLRAQGIPICSARQSFRRFWEVGLSGWWSSYHTGCLLYEIWESRWNRSK